MSKNKTFSVLFTLDNNKDSKGYIEFIEEINSMVFGVFVDTEEVNGIELGVEFAEQACDDKIEIECLLYDWDIYAMYGLIKNPVSVVVGTVDGEFEIEPSKLSIKEITELSEDGDIQYCTDTLAKKLTRI